jgi:RpiR family carbohydrate utilization transcriptional regulator
VTRGDANRDTLDGVTASRGAPNGGALTKLRSSLPHLPPALRRLAAAILERPKEAMYASITELAEVARVGEASVVRLCRDLGFSGFQDLKLALAADLAVRADEAAHSPNGDDLRGMLARVTAEAVAAVQETGAVVSVEALEAAVTALATASAVLIFGTGASGVTARDFAYKFLRLGLHAAVYEDAHLAAMAAATLPQGAVMLGITRSGSTIDTVQALRLARERGATTVLVTQRAKSPAAPYADVVLTSASSESPLTGGSIPSKMGQLLLLDVLYAALLRRRPGAQAAVAATARAVTDRNY